MAHAVLRGFRESPRKVRVVADMVRGRPVGEALSILRAQRRKAADMMEKVLGSAIANAAENDKADADALVVKQVAGDGGTIQKRFMPRAIGRSNRINKRTSHVTIVVDVVS